MANTEIEMPPLPEGFTLDKELPPLPKGFRLDSKAQSTPSMLSVAGNAAWKGLASVGDTALNVAGSVGNALIPPSLRPGAMQNPIATGLEAAGAIRSENEPQTAGQRVLDTGIRAGVNMLAGPATGLKSAAVNVAQGVTSGALAQITKEATGSDLLALAVGMVTPLAMSRMAASGGNIIQTATGKATLKEAKEAGYVVQPSTVKPTMATNRIESVAGKAAVAQDAALRNQAVTNRLAAKAIGLSEDIPITPSTLNQIRDKAAQPYREIEALKDNKGIDLSWYPRYHEKNLLEQMKQARADATAFYRSHDQFPNPAVLKQAKEADALAQSIEKDLEHIATVAGKPELVDQLRASRQLIARTYDVERALNVGDGNVSAAIIGRMLDKGRPLTGDLKVIGQFAQAFPRVARDASSLPPPSVSGTDAAASAMLGTIGYGAGGPAGLMAAGLPLLRSPARNLVLSGAYQSRLLKEAAPVSHSLLKGALVGKSLSDYQEAVQ